jgi:hypothetical protein
MLYETKKSISPTVMKLALNFKNGCAEGIKEVVTDFVAYSMPSEENMLDRISAIFMGMHALMLEYDTVYSLHSNAI